MRIKIIPLFILCIAPMTAFGITDWWNQDTICAIDETRCYRTLTAGISDDWDTTSGCRGMKYICSNALTSNFDEPIAMERTTIARGTGISTDFDTDVYVSGEDCYGARKSKNGGTMVSVNGVYVRVWCNGVLSNSTETLQDGQITTDPQPTCSTLAANNYAAILNGKCYGKYFDPNIYTIECDGDTPKLTLLNGANYNPSGRGLTATDASSTFNSMVSTSATQRGIHFNR